MAYSNPNIPTVNIITMDPENTLVLQCEVKGVPPAGATFAGIFALGCLATNVLTGAVSRMTGTTAVPAWTALS